MHGTCKCEIAIEDLDNFAAAFALKDMILKQAHNEESSAINNGGKSSARIQIE